MSGSKNSTIQVDESTAAALARRASARGQSISEVIADLIADHESVVEKDSAQITELERRWERFNKQPSTVPHDQVVRWLETWGTANYRPLSSR